MSVRVRVKVSLWVVDVLHLPHANDCIGHQDHQNDDRLHERSGGLLSFLEKSQHLQTHKYILVLYSILLLRQSHLKLNIVS